MEGESKSVRLERLEAVLKKALDKVTVSCNFDDFKESFKDSIQNELQERILFDLYTQVLQILRSNVEHEFRTIVEETGASQKLQELDALCSSRHDSRFLSKRFPTSTVKPEVAVRAQRVALKELEKERLKSMLNELNEQNETLKERLVAKRCAVETANETVSQVKQGANELAAINISGAWPPKGATPFVQAVERLP